MTYQTILETVSEYMFIPTDAILIKCNYPEIVRPRQTCIYFARIYKLGSLTQIGWHFGRKDHATVLHSERVIRNECDTNREFKQLILTIGLKLAAINKQELEKFEKISESQYEYQDAELTDGCLKYH
jgi:chromosomal replication initiator protein